MNYIGKFMPCQFCQVLLEFLSTIQALESAKPPKKYAFPDSTVPMKIKFLMELEEKKQGFLRF